MGSPNPHRSRPSCTLLLSQPTNQPSHIRTRPRIKSKEKTGRATRPWPSPRSPLRSTTSLHSVVELRSYVGRYRKKDYDRGKELVKGFRPLNSSCLYLRLSYSYYYLDRRYT